MTLTDQQIQDHLDGKGEKGHKHTPEEMEQITEYQKRKHNERAEESHNAYKERMKQQKDFEKEKEKFIAEYQPKIHLVKKVKRLNAVIWNYDDVPQATKYQPVYRPSGTREWSAFAGATEVPKKTPAMIGKVGSRYRFKGCERGIELGVLVEHPRFGTIEGKPLFVSFE